MKFHGGLSAMLIITQNTVFTIGVAIVLGDSHDILAKYKIAVFGCFVTKLCGLKFFLVFHLQPNASLTNTLTLTESTLTQHEKSDTPIVVKGPTKKLDRIPAGERYCVIIYVGPNILSLVF